MRLNWTNRAKVYGGLALLVALWERVLVLMGRFQSALEVTAALEYSFHISVLVCPAQK